MAKKQLIFNNSFSSNELITAISILAVLKDCQYIELTKSLLIEPLLSYKKILNKIKKSNTKIRSIEELIIKSDFSLSNFNKRFEEKLLLGINALYLLEQLGLAFFQNNCIYFSGKLFNFDEKSLGDKAKARIKSADKLSGVLKGTDASDLYLHLRVEL